MRDILIVFKEIEAEKPVDFFCIICGSHSTQEANMIEIRDRKDNKQLLGFICQDCFSVTKWNTNLEGQIMKT